MPDPRPYARHDVQELEAFFASGNLTRHQLRLLADELEKRSSARAEGLWQRVRDEISGMEAAGSSGSQSRSQLGHPTPGLGARNAAPHPTADAQTFDSIARAFGPALERVRKRLLDLTASNTLLNYRHPRASSLRIVDEIPAQVFDTLLADAGMTVVGLPTPSNVSQRTLLDDPEASDAQVQTDGVASIDGTREGGFVEMDPRQRAREERKKSNQRREALRRKVAQEFGIDPSHDLPAAHSSEDVSHQDKRLQTLLFPEELEGQLRKLRRLADTVIEETGANRLHLMFGFVEWHESGLSEAERVIRAAPLVLMPVRLTRGSVDAQTQTFRYTIERTGEDWSANVSLQEKCRSDFGLVLPDVEETEDETLEHYFAKVEGILRAAQPTWRLRRFVTLGVVSFGKILMWRDLDPKRWPANAPLFGNKIIRDLLGAQLPENDPDAPPTATGADYPIDDFEEHNPEIFPPTVIDADSSQHSALVDAKRGINLVLQGPPGTGKSQTIANLVASALKDGKRVLFVAEKKAALDVVHRRLQAAELGDFCLALHSHTSAKKEFIAELGERMAKRGTIIAPHRLDEHVRRHRDTRRVLTQHADRMHEPLESCGLTPYEVFWRALRLSLKLTDPTLTLIRDVRIERVAHTSLGDVDRRRDLIADYAAAYRNVCEESGALSSHPWAGVENPGLTFPDVDDLLDLAHAMHTALAALVADVMTYAASISSPVPESAQGLRRLQAAVLEVTPLCATTNPNLPNRILAAGDVPPVRAAVDAVLHSRDCWAKVTGPWATPGTLHRSAAADVTETLIAQSALTGKGSLVADIRVYAEKAEQALKSVRDGLSAISRVLTPMDLATDDLATDQVLMWVAAADASSRLLNESPHALEQRSDATADPLLDGPIERLVAEAARLRLERATLEDKFLPSLRPKLDELRGCARTLAVAPPFLPWLFSGSYRKAARSYRAMAGGARASRAVMTRDVWLLVRHLEAVQKFVGDEVARRVFAGREVDLDAPFDAVLAVIRWRREIRDITRSIEETGGAIAERCWQAPTAIWRRVAQQASACADKWESARALGETLQDASTIPGVAPWQHSVQSLRQQSSRLDTYAQACQRFIRLADAGGAAPTNTPADLQELFVTVVAAWEADDEMARRAETLAAIGVAVLGARTDVTPVLDALNYIGSVRSVGLPEAATSWLLGPDAPSRLTTLRDRGDTLLNCVSTYEGAASRFADAAQLNQGRWFDAAGEDPRSSAEADALYSRPVSELLTRLNKALQRDKALHPMAVYRHSRHSAITDGLTEIVRLLEAELVIADEAITAYETVFYRSLAALVLRERRELDQFDSGRHTETQSRFVSLDSQLQQFNRREIARGLSSPLPIPGNPGPRVADLTEEALLRNEVGKQRRHAAIREMFRRAGQSILAMKPCFMMGPQAVAQYLEPGRFQFDLVVMDEASQMRPEDALGAVLRGRQVVIVGDPMQLGPTRFFDKLDHEEEDEASSDVETESEDEDGKEPQLPVVTGATVLERSESILLAAAACYPVRMLRWHYRSRHPKLIAFSNREFYNERLIIFPTTGGTDADDGVFMRRVEGLYGARRNVLEAQSIVAAIRDHAVAYPERSLMVATMNAEQSDLVDTLVSQTEKADPALARYLAHHETGPEPFAIKNLENVQGDERDVIFVSVTYGPNAEGRLLQQFGPILQHGGERRLNVLFTRARHRLDVFCSFDPNDLRVTDSSPRGLRVLRDYLKFASGEVWWASGTATGREPDSDFEIAIAEALGARAYETRPQVGVAGYFIDIGVVDPDHPGRFILGIEADGATYHSAKTARDRDRLRQAQLESLGWKIHRIWSTDWFKDPAGQVARVVARIEGLRAGKGAPAAT